MQATITINAEVLQKAKQAVLFTHFQNVEDFITSLIEEKLNEMSPRKPDLIHQLRGKLKGKHGGTSLFMRDKQVEIEKEYNL